MISRVFSVYDSAARTYSQPFYSVGRGVALRQFEALVNDGQSTVSRWPKDFSLFELGSFNDETAIFIFWMRLSVFATHPLWFINLLLRLRTFCLFGRWNIPRKLLGVADLFSTPPKGGDFFPRRGSCLIVLLFSLSRL